MRKSLSMLRTAVILAVAGTVFMYAFLKSGSVHRPEIPAMPGVSDQKDDPGAAARFEWMRLRDPATGEIPRDIRRKELEFASRLPSREQLAKNGRADGALVASWSRRGPFNVGGRTRALGVDVGNESIILAGGVSGGMWRSTNSGGAWVKTSAYDDLHSVTCLVQDTRPGKKNIWYYGTGEYRGNSANGGGAFFNGNGIYKSADNGMSWNVLPSTIPGDLNTFDQAFDYTWNLASDPSSNQDVVYAATAGGIQRTSDGGATWDYVLGGLTNDNSTYTDVAVTAGGVVYAALSDLRLSGTGGSVKRGLYRSTDGVTWTSITPSSFPTAYARIVLAVAPSDPAVVYFLVANANGSEGANQTNGVQFWRYTYVSGDGSGTGGAWVSRGQNLPNESGLSGNAKFDTQSNYNMLLRVKPNDPDFVVAGGTNLYVSSDGFATTSNWWRIGGYASPSTYQWYAGHHPDQHAGVFLSDNVTFVSGHDEGVARTTDVTATSVSWTRLNAGYFTTQFYTIALDHATSGNNVILGGMQDNGIWSTVSSSVTSSWVRQVTGDGVACAIADGRTSYYASIQNGKTYRLILNSSGSLQDYTRIDPQGASGYLFANPLILDPTDDNVVYTPAGSSLWMNSNVTEIPLRSASPSSAESTKTQNWTNLTAAGVSGATITALAASAASPSHRLYYGTDDGRVYRLDAANAASAATVPTDVWTGKGFPAGGFVSGLAVDPTEGDRALIVFSNYGIKSVFFTTDGGNSWSDVEGNLAGNSGPSVRTARIIPVGGTTTYFLGTSTGLYSTTGLDGASTVWEQEGASVIGNVVVNALDARPLDGTVIAGTHGAGAFSAILSTTDVRPDEVPARASLLQNYPNPFNPSTTIRYTVPERSAVELTIHNELGQQVRELVRSEVEAGYHEATFDATGLSSGVYFSMLKAGNSVLTQKMLCIR